MRSRIQLSAAVAIAFGLAASAGAQEAKTVAANAEIVKALTAAMEPGEGQKRLEFMVGTFDVKIRTWVDPSEAPVESRAVAVCQWVLGNRYVQNMLSGFVAGEPFNAIGYAGFDNVTNKYVATYMDSGSTGMEWFTGTMDPDGKLAKMTTTVYDEVSLEPRQAEMRLGIATNGDHVTELWQADGSGKLVKVIELQYTRRKS